MRDIQEALLEQEVEEEIPNQVNTSIEVPSHPRHALQKILQPTPGKKKHAGSAAKTTPIKNVPENKSAAAADPGSPAQFADITEKKLRTTPLRNSLKAQPQELTFSGLWQNTQSAFSSGIKLTRKFVSEEWAELCNDPLNYFQSGLDSIASNCMALFKIIFKPIFEVTSSACSSAKKFANLFLDATFGEWQWSDPYSKSQPISFSTLSWLIKGNAPATESRSSNSKNSNTTIANSITDDPYYSPVIKKKGILELLREGAQQLVDALLEKKARHKSDYEAEIEHKEKIEKEARARLRKAETLRPDLADELDLPETDSIFPSSFDELPNVDELIRIAEERKALKMLH